MRNLRPFLPAVVLLVGCASILQTRSQRAVPLPAPASTITPPYDGFKSRTQVLSPEEIGVAGMTDYVARVYTKDSVVAFSTLVSYYDRQMQGRTIHSPRNCLPGAGWEVLTPGTRVLTVGGETHVVNHYVLKNASATAVVMYWYQGRGRVVANEYAVKWNLLKDAALRGHTEEALVRVVVPVQTKAGSVSQATALQTAEGLAAEVAAKLLVSVDRSLPKP